MNALLLAAVATLQVVFMQPSNSQTLSYSGTFGDNFDLDIEISEDTTLVRMAGPSGRWLGIGFGDTVMLNTYSVIYGSRDGSSDPDLFEDKLGGSNLGTELTECNGTCAVLLNYTDTGSKTVVWFERDNTADTTSSDVYTFSNTVDTLKIIWAYGTAGSGTDLEYHANRDGETITFSTQEAEEATSYTFYYELEDLGMEITMVLTATEMEFVLSGPSDRWFAIAWGGHTSGDALMYTTGADGASPEYAYDGHLNDKTENSNTNNGIDTTQNWVINDVSTEDGTTTVTATRVLATGDSDDNDFEFPPGITEYYFAHGATANDYTLEYHTSANYLRLDVDLEAGTATVVEDTDFTTKEHGIFMFIAFGVCMPWGSFVNRYLGFSICSKIRFFREYAYLSVQLHIVMMLMAWVFALVGFITKWADSQNDDMFDSLHGTFGYIALIMQTLITFGTYFGNKQNIVVPRHTGQGDVKATNGHRIFGLIFILFGMFVVMTGIGSEYGSDSTYAMLYIVYVLLLIISCVILEVAGCSSSDKNMMNKAVVNDNASTETLPIVLERQGTRLMTVDTGSQANNLPTEAAVVQNTNSTANTVL